jgi:coenzyme PQQ biosynthesis protein PqqD
MNRIDDRMRPALARGVRLERDRLTGRPVLLYPEGVLRLNGPAHAILSRCDGQTTVEGIVAALAGEYEAALEELRGDVVECLDQLQGDKLVVLSL